MADKLEAILSHPDKRQQIYIDAISKEAANFMSFPLKRYRARVEMLCESLIPAEEIESVVMERRFDRLKNGFIDAEISPNWQWLDAIIPADNWNVRRNERFPPSS